MDGDALFVGRLVYRERNALNTIGFAALCLLVVSPRSLFDSSLQMTLLAVIAIAGVAAPLLQGTIHPYLTATRDLRLVAIDIKLAPRLAEFRVMMRMVAERIERAGNRWLAWRIFPWGVRFAIRFAELVVVSCVVELAMTLPMAVYFHRITIFALPVNLLILPLLVVLMPAALLTLLLLVVWPAAAVVPAMVVALVMHFGVGLVRLFGSMALGDFRIPNPLLWQSAVFCALLGAAIVLAHESLGCGARGTWRGTPWMRRSAWAVLAIAALVAVMPRPVERPKGAMLMEAIDVGQGDSLLVITPDGKTLLIDGGGFGGGPKQAPQDFDIGEEVVSPALWARGIRHLDVVALSHAHSDHMGGLPAVLRNFHPDELWVGNNPRFGAYNALLDEAAALHVRVRSFRAGDAFTFGSTQVNVLAPFRDYQPGAEPSNNDSLVLHVGYGATSVMLEGDAEAPIEQAMLAEQGLASTLLKVGHHGSITSTRPEFLKRVGAAMGGDFERASQSIWASARGGAGGVAGGACADAADGCERDFVLCAGWEDDGGDGGVRMEAPMKPAQVVARVDGLLGIERALPAWMARSFSSSGLRSLRSRALAPSDLALCGSSWTSTKRPSMPAATAARASSGMYSGWPPLMPFAAEGCWTEWVASKTTGARRRMMASERKSTTRLL